MPPSQQQQQHFDVSQVPANPSFRNAAVNAVAVVPLLSHDQKGEISDTHSARSFTDLIEALRRHSCSSGSDSISGSSSSSNNNINNNSTELLLVVPNSALTRPGDWRYQETPLKAFHWQHGCQRLQVHDGRPQCSRRAHDRLLNASLTRDWIDLCPSRRTAAVIGVLNMRDCCNNTSATTTGTTGTTDTDTTGTTDGNAEMILKRACEELQQWAVRYSTPPYAVTAHGRGGAAERDVPVTRLFVYDSFDEDSQKIDLAGQTVVAGTSILAFPPADKAHQQMMDLHLNVVVSDLTVAIFRDLEQKIRESMGMLGKEQQQQQQPELQPQAGLARRSLARLVSRDSSGDGTATPSGAASNNEEEPVKSSRTLGISQLAGLVSPDSKLAKDSPSSSSLATRIGHSASFAENAATTAAPNTAGAGANVQSSSNNKLLPLLLTPLDDDSVMQDPSQVLGLKDAEAVRKRDMGRHEKQAADLCLLAGSPLDAYERYLKAAELCKTPGSMDPLWHASALEGCAAAHIAMAEAGGYR